MKKNGFVQAVTKAIGYGTDRHWSTIYYIDAGDTYNERMPYDGPMLEDVSIGPEYDEFLRMRIDMICSGKPNAYRGLKQEEIIS